MDGGRATRRLDVRAYRGFRFAEAVANQTLAERALLPHHDAHIGRREAAPSALKYTTSQPASWQN
jgi:hypothetical protein